MSCVQVVLYDQLHQAYLSPHADAYLFLLSSKPPMSPYGTLQLNRFSLDIERKASQRFIQSLQSAGRKAARHETESYGSGVLTYCLEHGYTDVVIMRPSEPLLARQWQRIAAMLAHHAINVHREENKQFLLSHQAFCAQFSKPPIMEVFYRWMRKKYNILMDGNKPMGGKWNYDKENRKFDRTYIPQRTSSLRYPCSRPEALAALDDFITHYLDRFGELEDAMYQDDYMVHHSLLSSSLNFGLLTPREVIDAIAHADTAINNKEGCIRQILGRREYMYHWFHYYQESIYQQNYLEHTRTLPDRFWWPEMSPLQMNCVNHVLHTVKETGYSHHITRLMIIGNFCLLVGYNPHDVNKRFWEMYADAFERVVTPNVLGMSQFADGGNLATKPYISSANYINNMSDYCTHCYYDPKQKTGDRACPMNYLYRTFIDTHKELFRRQPYMVSNLAKIDIDAMKQQTHAFISSLEQYDHE